MSTHPQPSPALVEAARPSWDEVAEPDGLVGDVDLAAVGSCKATILAFEPEVLPELLAVWATRA